MKSRYSRKILNSLIAAAVVALAITPHAASPKFYADDPMSEDVDDRDASHVRTVDIDHTSYGWRMFQGAGDHSTRRARNVNTVGEVPNSNWFTNRIGLLPLSVADIARGPDSLAAPPHGPWTVVGGKIDGVTPGLRLKDAAGRLFFCKFDPPGNPEMASGAEVVATKLLFALGYWVPENYIATLRREELVIGDHATFTDPDGKKRAMTTADINRVLDQAAQDRDGSYRMLASLAVEGKPVGPFQYFGVRSDDPNDIVPHEHRRELRALRVFAAWINHVDTKAQNSLDTLVKTGTKTVVRHYLLDFGSSLGSAGTEPKTWHDGFEYAWERRTTLLALLTFGTRTPPWLRIHYPNFPSIGRIESRHFQPARWKPTMPNPAFQNAQEDDMFWAARRVMAFSDDDIVAVVAQARFSDPAAARYLSDVLIDRRNRIGQVWLTDVNPVTDPVLDERDRLAFGNAAIDARVTDDRPEYRVRWSIFDNATRVATPLGPWSSVPDTTSAPPADVPASAEFLQIEIAAVHPNHPSWARPVRAYFHRNDNRSWSTVGFERIPDDQ